MRTARKTQCARCQVEIVATDDDSLPLCEECGELKQLVDLVAAFQKGEFTVNGLNRYEIIGLNADGSEVEEDGEDED